MLHSRSGRVLLVAPDVFSVKITGHTQLRHITSVDRVFPAIFEMVPNIIVFDYEYLSDDMEKILRRIRTNPYYNKIRICCFKKNTNSRLDSFLRMLGVNEVIYKEGLKDGDKSTVSKVKSIFNSTITDLLVSAEF